MVPEHLHQALREGHHTREQLPAGSRGRGEGTGHPPARPPQTVPPTAPDHPGCGAPRLQLLRSTTALSGVGYHNV